MKLSMDIWRIVRLYVEDWKEEFPPPYADKLLGAIRSRCVSKVVELCREGAQQYRTPFVYRLFTQTSAFVRKNESLVDVSLATVNARRNFDRAERICRITNKRLTWYFADAHDGRLDPELGRWISTMQRVIAHTLGPIDNFFESLDSSLRVTSGASVNLPRAIALPVLKMRRRGCCSRRLVPFITKLAQDRGYAVEPRVVDYNRIALVPKNYELFRTIAAEPEWSLPFQLAVDMYWKDCLQSLGINLRTGQMLHQRLARQASIDGRRATVDFSMFSDTIAMAVVGLLFPEAWWTWLCWCRSPCYTGAFGSGRYAKFSSMGNGYTFVIETLILAAACVAVGSRSFSVYGDDVIIETELWPKFRKLTKFLGFVPNDQKTFYDVHDNAETTSPLLFRESCGGDYLNGVDVTPLYVHHDVRCDRDAPKGPICHMVNLLVKVGRPHGRLWNYALAAVAEHDLPIVPASETTDNGVHIPVRSAYGRGLIRLMYNDHSGGIPDIANLAKAEQSVEAWKSEFAYARDVEHVRQVVEKRRTRHVHKSWKALTLWFWKAEFVSGPLTGDGDLRIASEVPTDNIKSVVKWAPWRPPLGSVHENLYWFETLLPTRRTDIRPARRPNNNLKGQSRRRKVSAANEEAVISFDLPLDYTVYRVEVPVFDRPLREPADLAPGRATGATLTDTSYLSALLGLGKGYDDMPRWLIESNRRHAEEDEVD